MRRNRRQDAAIFKAALPAIKVAAAKYGADVDLIQNFSSVWLFVPKVRTNLVVEPVIDRAKLESEKARLTQEYEDAVESLYREQMAEILIWFKAKFPKRKLQWVSGMGTCFWALDDKILHWDVLAETRDKQCYPTGWREPFPDRKQQLLKPLWDFFMSIHDNSNYLGQWIHIGDHSTEDLP